jgi:hypothetical protein
MLGQGIIETFKRPKDAVYRELAVDVGVESGVLNAATAHPERVDAMRALRVLRFACLVKLN